MKKTLVIKEKGVVKYQAEIESRQGSTVADFDKIPEPGPGPGPGPDPDNYYTKTEVDSKLSGKVSKEDGKGLSSNDYTNEDKSKVSAIPNKQDKLVSGTNIKTINGESVLGEGNLEITAKPGKYVADLYISDSGDNARIMSNDGFSYENGINVSNKKDYTSIYIFYHNDGSSGDVAYTSNILPNKEYTDKTYQAKEEGKGLSTNDFTNDAKTKLYSLTPSRELTQAEYDDLSDEEKNNGTTYFITDGEGGGGGGAAINYTTAERRIGTYLGKPLYEITYTNLTVPAYDDSGTARFGSLLLNTLGFSDDWTIINFEGLAKMGSVYALLPMAYTTKLEDNRSPKLDSRTAGIFKFASGWTLFNTDTAAMSVVSLTIRYVKEVL